MTTALDLNYSINSLTFAVSGASSGITSVAVNPNGYSLTMGTGGVTLDVSSTASATIGAGSIILAGSQSWANNNSSLGLTINAAVAPANGIGPTTLIFNGTGAGGVTLNGSFGNAAFSPLSLVFNQAGVTQLNGSNTFTGGVTISSGTLQLGSAGALNAASPSAVTFSYPNSSGIGDLQLNGKSVTVSALNANDGTVSATVENAAASPATLTVSDTGSNTYNGVLQDGGGGSLALTKAGTGTLYLTGVSNTYTGGTNLNGGVLNFVTGALPVSGISFHGGTLQWAYDNTQDVSAGMAPIAAGQAAILDTNGNDVSFASPLSGSGGLTKLGGGLLTLTTNNSYSGVTTVTGGTLQIDTGGNTATLGGGSIAIGSGAVVALDRGDNVVLNNSFSGGGTLYQIGPGTATLAGNNTGVGITVGNGAVTLAGTNTGLGQITVTSYGTLTIAGSAVDDANARHRHAERRQRRSERAARQFVQHRPHRGGCNVRRYRHYKYHRRHRQHLRQRIPCRRRRRHGHRQHERRTAQRVQYRPRERTFLCIGYNYPSGDVSGTFNMSGGSIQVAGSVSVGTFPLGQGTLNVSGGTIQSDLDMRVGDAGYGTMTLSGSGVAIAPLVTMGQYGTAVGTGSGTLNLQGGLLRTGGVNSYTGLAVFNFSGGTLENVAGGNLNVTMPVNLDGPGTVVLQSSATGAFTTAAPISGNGSLLLTGGGELILSGNNTYEGGTVDAGGMLILASPNAILAGNSLDVGAAASSIFGAELAGQVSAAQTVSPVPEPSTLALLMAGLVVGLGVWQRRRRS